MNQLFHPNSSLYEDYSTKSLISFEPDIYFNFEDDFHNLKEDCTVNKNLKDKIVSNQSIFRISSFDFIEF